MNIPASKNIYLPIAMLAAAVMLIGTSWIGDDAFITLRVIDNFVNGFGLRYNVIERVQVFTHPLWLIFLTPFYSLTREAMVTTMLVSMILSLGALWLMATKITRNVEYGSLLVLASVASGSLCNFSTSGLESPLSYLLLALFVWQLFRSEKKWIPAFVAGLIFFNRLDLVILVGPALAYLLFQSQGNERAKIALVAIFPMLAWMIFSIIYYGAPFPNTAYAKLGTGFSTGMLILRGLEYTKDFVITDPLLALIIGKALFDAWYSRNLLSKLLALGIVFYIAYIIVIGGDFMSGRFFAPPGFLAVCLLARAPVPQWFTEKAKMFALISVVGIVATLLLMRVTGLPSTPIPSDSIGDERLFYYSDNGFIPVLKRWAETGVEPVHRWGKWGMELKAEAQRTGMPVVALEGNTGMTGYYAGTALHNVDEFALTDAFLARLPAIPGARVGHYQRLIPPGYAETAPNTFPTTSVIALRPLLNDVTLATRAPLFADGRWAAIWRLLSGHYSWVYDANIYGVGK